MKVALRQRKKGQSISLYLDYYNKGNRSYEYLELYLIPEPEKGKLTKEQRNSNKETFLLAESIRSKRQVEIQNGIYGFQNQTKLRGSFLRYVEYLAEKRKSSEGNYGNWDSALKHLKKFAKHDVTFLDVNKKWLEGFKEYLMTEAKTPGKKPHSQNSQSSYYNKIRAALKQAVKDDIIVKNPAMETDGIKAGETEREFLTLDELKRLAKTECEIPVLKPAFLFSALTGLRWSDVQKLTWSEVFHSKELGYYIRFKQKKTKGVETLPISEQAYKLLNPGPSDDKIFKGLKYSSWTNLKLQQWMTTAGITRNISFHASRHTYATLQLSLGTDIYTVSKLLGHKDLKSTQVYARVIDQRKKEAANKISII